MRSFRFAVCAGTVALLAVGFGCGKKDTPAPTTKETKKDSTGTPTLPTAAPAANTEEAKAAALKAATEFVKAVQEGKASSASLTVAYKKVIAPWELEADKASGYSESGVQAWLTNAKTTAVSENLQVDYATADFAFAGTNSSKPGKTLLRLIRTGGTWQIDYAIFGTASPYLLLSNGDKAAPTFAAIAFAEALAVKNFTAVESLLTKEAKGKLAPPLFDDDKPQGYSKSKLRSLFADLFGTPLEVANIVISGSASKFDISIIGKTKRLDLKLIPGTTPGEYLIDDLQQK